MHSKLPPQPKPLPPKAALFVGALCLAAGLPSLLGGLGLIGIEMAAPPWVVACAGLCFTGAGVAFIVSAWAPKGSIDGALAPDAPAPLRLIEFLAALAVPAGFAGMMTWFFIGDKAHEMAQMLAPLLIVDVVEVERRLRFGVAVASAVCWSMFLVLALHGARKLLCRVRGAGGNDNVETERGRPFDRGDRGDRDRRPRRRNREGG
ncbi:MAG: hypothetical protein JNJ73_08195 [Hyphomonadaceae bacterium]|nr:hypothetical protein [Hyphomonadaceae bacterium]